MKSQMAGWRLQINCGLLIAGLLAIVIPLQAGSADVADAAKARDAAAVKAL
jgi:hypothetical protein